MGNLWQSYVRHLPAVTVDNKKFLIIAAIYVYWTTGVQCKRKNVRFRGIKLYNSCVCVWLYGQDSSPIPEFQRLPLPRRLSLCLSCPPPRRRELPPPLLSLHPDLLQHPLPVSSTVSVIHGRSRLSNLRNFNVEDTGQYRVQ